MQNSTDPLVREVYEKMIKPPRGLGVRSVADGGQLLRSPRFAYFGADVSLYKSIAMASFTESEICRLREVDLEPDLYVSPGLRKVASIVPYFRVAIAVQLERGVVSRELRVWQDRRPACLEGLGQESGAVGIEPIVPALGLLMLGLCVSSAALFREISRWRAAVKKTHANVIDSPSQRGTVPISKLHHRFYV